jgi:hypothetical protein
MVAEVWRPQAKKQGKELLEKEASRHTRKEAWQLRTLKPGCALHAQAEKHGRRTVKD